MMESSAGNGAVPVSGAGSQLEASLRQLFGEQARLRALLDRTRDDLDRVNARVLQMQEEYCTDSIREKEYCECLKRIIGIDPREVESQVEQVLANGQLSGEDELQKLIAEIETDERLLV